MIVGNGLIADGFIRSQINFDNWVIFASGVSSSMDDNIDNFKREKDLLIKILKDNNHLKFIYFSSVLVGISDKQYYKHKLEMENLVKSEHNNYIIFRTPQIVGPTGNKNNLFNFLQNKIKNNEVNIIYNEIERALIDIDDLVQLVKYVSDKLINETIVLSHIEKITVLELCKKIASKLGLIPIITVKELSSDDLEGYNNWNVKNSSIVNDWLNGNNINGYTDKIIDKYIKNNGNINRLF